MIKKLNKKGSDPVSPVLVGVIIVIISGIILIVFVVITNPKKMTDEEVCHNAVLTRAASVLPKETVPLTCKTSYVCISKDGTCEAMTNPEIIKANTADDVYNALANQMVNCWAMFGEGSLDYIGNKYDYDLYCSICSQIAFDNSLDNLFATNPSAISRASAGIPETDSNFLIDKKKFYDYLSNNNVSGKDVSYINYFLGLQNSKLLSDALQDKNSNYGYIDLKKQYFVTMGEFSSVGTFQNILLGVMKGFELFFVIPIPLAGGPLAMGIIASTLTGDNYKGTMIATIITGKSGHGYLSPTLIEANSEDWNKLKCADIKTLA
jgi:hypothetical protein